MKDPSQRTPAWKRHPWFWAVLLGLLFVTAIRPCTRHIPEAPPELIPAEEVALSKSLLSKMQGKVSLVLLPGKAKKLSPDDYSVMTRLSKGIALWESPLALWVLEHVSEAPQQNGKDPQELPWETQSIEEDSWLSFSKQIQNLEFATDGPTLVLFSSAGAIHGYFPAERDGGIEAFHKGIRLILEENKADSGR